MYNITITVIIVAVLIITVLLTYREFRRRGSLCWRYVTADAWLSSRRTCFATKRIAVVSHDDRKSTDIEKLKQLNKEYCDKHGYDFHFFDRTDEKVPPYWIKVYEIQKLLSRYDYVLWIDSDAVFHDTRARLESLSSLLSDEEFLIISSDSPMGVFGSLRPAAFNAGVWMIKNTSIARVFMEDWITSFNPERWFLGRDRRWYCDACEWAGKFYEQGAGLELMKSERFCDKIVQVDWSVMQSAEPTRASFVLHFSGVDKEKIKLYNR